MVLGAYRKTIAIVNYHVFPKLNLVSHASQNIRNKSPFQFVNVNLCGMNIWHLSREIGVFGIVFLSPYHSWVPLQLGLPQICPAVGWGSHRWQQPERYQTQHTAWAGQPATAAHSHSLMRWNPVAWQDMHTHAHRGRWACRKGQKGLSGPVYENAFAWLFSLVTCLSC